MGWVRQRDGSLDWQDPRTGHLTTHVPAERVPEVEASWAEQARLRGGREAHTASLTEREVREALSGPSDAHGRAMGELRGQRAYDARIDEAEASAQSEVARVSTGGRHAP